MGVNMIMPPSFSDHQHTVNTMTLTGQGQVVVVPDIAIIRLGVQTTGENLATVQAENAELSQMIIATLDQLDVSEITTFQYVIDKLYDYENNQRIDKGYSVRNILELRLDNVENAGIVIDAAVNSGANVVELIDFSVSDAQLHYQEALNLAVLNAHDKAKSLTLLLNLIKDPTPIRINETSASPLPYSQFDTRREVAFATPIEPGNKRITASVTVVFEYSY